jgi:DNA-binding transcriptional MocR family regulator
VKLQYKYEKLVSQIIRQIENGSYNEHEKLPGIRTLSRVTGTSISTVITAYQVLESRGYIEAKARSGYCVKKKFWLPEIKRLPVIGLSAPSLVKTQVIALDLIKQASRIDGFSFGEAVPTSQYYPYHDLQRSLRRVAKSFGHAAMRYENPQGNHQLRTIISRRMADYGAFISPDDILITNGAQEAVMLSLRLITSPGDIVVVESPTFYGLLQSIDSLGLKVIEIPTYPKSGMCLESLKLAIEKWQVKACLCIPNFNNPTGILMPDPQKKKLVEILAEHNVPLIEDDTYGDLGHQDVRPSSCISLSQKADVFYCSGFSKTISPDLRIGWVTNPLYTKQLLYQKFIANLSTSSFPQLVVADVLSRGHYDKHLKQVRNDYKSALNTMLVLIEKYFPVNTKISLPEGGFVLWVALPGSIDSMDLLREVNKNGISLAPGIAFSANNKYANFMRLSFACHWNHAAEQALKTIGTIAKRLLVEPVKSFKKNA